MSRKMGSWDLLCCVLLAILLSKSLSTLLATASTARGHSYLADSVVADRLNGSGDSLPLPDQFDLNEHVLVDVGEHRGFWSRV